MKWIIIGLLSAAALFGQSRNVTLPWWDNPIASGIDLTDIQRRQISRVTREFRNRLVDARAAVEKAENDLEDVFNEEAVDQSAGMQVVEELSEARANLTRAMSEMTLRLRAVLTTDQWQELQRRERDRGRSAPPPKSLTRNPSRSKVSVTKN